VNFTVYLKLRNAAAAAATARAVSTPGNAAYGRYLSNAAFNARFAPAGATIRTLTAWLKSQSLKVSGVAANHMWVMGSGSVAAVGKAFGTSFAVYKVNGHNRRSVTDPVSLPSGLAGHVAAVGGLTQIAMKPAAPPSVGFRVAPPCSKYDGQKVANNLPKVYGKHRPWAVCGYTPKQLRDAYGVTRSGLSGRGSTVAITDAYDSPTLPADANTFAHRHGLPGFAPGQYRDISDPNLKDQPNDPNCGDWYGEQTLDVEAVHEMAPKAKVVYSGGVDCFDDGLLNALHKVVDGHKAQIVTNSWGDVELDSTPDSTLAYHQLFRPRPTIRWRQRLAARRSASTSTTTSAGRPAGATTAASSPTVRGIPQCPATSGAVRAAVPR
jgi:subtilase family serine protease